MITTDINKWLDALELDNHYEIYDLYTAVSSEMNMTFFHVGINESYPRRLYIMPVSKDVDTLMLTDKSKPLFIRLFQDKFCGGEDCETFFSLEVLKEKSDEH